MAQRITFFILFLLLGPVAVGARAAAPAQTLPARIPGSPRTVVLPKLLIAGEPATLAVLDAAGRLVPAVDVDLSGTGRVTTGDTGRALFTAPTRTGLLTARIIETGFDFTTAVLAAAPDAQSPAKDYAPPRVMFPSVIAVQNKFDVLCSGFSGDAGLDSVVLGNLPALVLAASPVSLVALPNLRTSVGPAELAISKEGGRVDRLAVAVVSLQVAGPTVALSANEKGTLTVTLRGSPEKLLIEVNDLTPQVVKLRRGASDRLFTSGGPSNVATIEVVGVRAGDYSISARLVPAVGALAIEAARRQLLAARPFADASWQKRIDSLTQKMDDSRAHFKENDPQRAARFQQELGGWLKDRPPEQVAGPLRVAAQSLSGN